MSSFPSMRLAVIIPSYNHARYIGTALESVLSQTRRPDRILVIDDGSKDSSVDVIRSFAGRGVECTAWENRGAHLTLNELVNRAAEECDAISILNSDDHYHPERFEKCLPLLEEDAEAQVVTSGLRVIDENDANLDPGSPRARWFRAAWSLSAPDRDLCEWLGVANFPATTSNVIARSSWLKRFPFRPYRFNHDYYFLAQSALRGGLRLHPEALVNYRVHSTNTMNTDPAPLLREMLRMNLDLARDLAPELASDAPLRSRYARYSRALWDSISSFHPELYQMLLAGAAARLSPQETEQAVASLAVEQFPELASYPNRFLTRHWDGVTPINSTAGLADKYEMLRKSEKDLKVRNRASEKLAALRGRIMDSRWLAWGRALGLWRPPILSQKATAGGGAAVLQQRMARQRWVRLGRRLGMAKLDD
ncbi:MAG: glycosyltransferase family 2 protein [Verrucomicrobiales bacterium]|nr:glycosyltransferase family 2 protein [Verrucomicrobiales bacterium]